jgi:GNAT superfamily N-acetyltransferase
MTFTQPERLEAHHVREGFASGAEDLDEWLAKYAWQNQKANNCVTFVTCKLEDTRVLGYYAITVAGVAREETPARVAKGARRQVPCLLLARLAVDKSAQGSGMGRGLLADAIARTAGLAEEVGIRAMLIHARDEGARSFYMAHGEFLESPVDPLQLMLPVADVLKYKRSVAASGESLG